jgi:hypothetical protein
MNQRRETLPGGSLWLLPFRLFISSPLGFQSLDDRQDFFNVPLVANFDEKIYKIATFSISRDYQLIAFGQRILKLKVF